MHQHLIHQRVQDQNRLTNVQVLKLLQDMIDRDLHLVRRRILPAIYRRICDLGFLAVARRAQMVRPDFSGAIGNQIKEDCSNEQSSFVEA